MKQLLESEGFSDCVFVVAATRAVDTSLYDGLRCPVVYDQSYNLLQVADAALVNSGTATLETALFEVPQVVCYQLKMARISFPIIYNLLLHIPHVSLVNILAQKQVVVELLGPNFQLDNTLRELHRVLDDTRYRETVMADYKQLKSDLGTQIASESAARSVVGYLRGVSEP